jgi:hypothetical protein
MVSSVGPPPMRCHLRGLLLNFPILCTVFIGTTLAVKTVHKKFTSSRGNMNYKNFINKSSLDFEDECFLIGFKMKIINT